MLDVMYLHVSPLVVYWVYWLVFINLFSIIFVIRHPEARWIIGVFILVGISMEMLFQQIGFVRLLGIVHIVFWTPLLIYLFRRVSKIARKTFFGVYIRIYMLTISISLVIDYVDVVRYFLGHGY